MRKQLLLSLFIAVPALTAVPLASAQTVATAHADTLVKSESSWNGVKYVAYPSTSPQLTVIKLTIPAHTALPWHKHPVPNAGYVLAGQLTIEDRESGRKKTFTTGQAFAESVNDVHRGISGDVPTVLILTYSGTKGTPTSIPVDSKQPEY